MQSNTKRTTIMRQHIIRLLMAIAAGLLVFLLLYLGSGFFTDRFFEESGYYVSHDKQFVRSLQEYVDENQIASTDDRALSEWGKQQGDIFYQIYNDDELLFQYYGRGSKSFQQAANLEYLEWINPYDVQFADGTYQVMIFGDYYYKSFKYSMAISVLCAFAVFLAVFLPAIRKRTRYITKLRDEIEILGSGDLDYEVTVRGNDELTDLAENLDQMREALRHHMEEENRLAEERQSIVTRLSHDIRTPLTSMNLFADLLKRGDYETEAQRDHYIDRIQENAANLTNLAEELFHAAKDTGQAIAPETKQEQNADAAKAGFDLVSAMADAAEALRLTGFTVREYYTTANLNLPVDKQSFSRILDNITSNISRYADPTEPVLFSCEESGSSARIAFENVISSSEETNTAGSGIGLLNVQELMQKEGGSVEIESDESRFLVRLTIPMES